MPEVPKMNHFAKVCRALTKKKKATMVRHPVQRSWALKQAFSMIILLSNVP